MHCNLQLFDKIEEICHNVANIEWPSDEDSSGRSVTFELFWTWFFLKFLNLIINSSNFITMIHVAGENTSMNVLLAAHSSQEVLSLHSNNTVLKWIDVYSWSCLASTVLRVYLIMFVLRLGFCFWRNKSSSSSSSSTTVLVPSLPYTHSTGVWQDSNSMHLKFFDTVGRATGRGPARGWWRLDWGSAHLTRVPVVTVAISVVSCWSKIRNVLTLWFRLMRRLQLRFDFDSTAVRLLIKGR